MKKSIYKKNPLAVIIAAAAPSLFTVAVLACIMLGLGRAERSSREEGRRALEDAVRRAVATCYAVEGSYPESVDYIERHYGVRITESSYDVWYEIFADNLFPNILVTEK